MTETIKLSDIITCQMITAASTEQICKKFGIPPHNDSVWNIVEDGKILATFKWTFGALINENAHSSVCTVCKYDNKFEDYITICVYCGAKMNVYLDGKFEDGEFRFKIIEYRDPREQHIWI